MLNGNFLIEERENALEKLRIRMDKLKRKLEIIIEKNIYFLKLVKETDGNLNIIPEIMRTRQRQVDDISIWIDRTLPKMYVGNRALDIKNLEYELVSYELTYNMDLEKYDETLDDLINLYSKKNEIVEKISKDNKIDYRHEILKMLNVFRLHGVYETSLVYFDRGVGVNFEEREKQCLEKMTNIINEILPIDISINDYEKVKEILDKLFNIRLMDVKTKDDLYNSIEEYISELENKRSYSKK